MPAAGASRYLSALSLLASGWIMFVGIPGRAWSQTHDMDPAVMATAEEAHPTLHIHGFSNVDYLASDAPGAHGGFQLGQFALHLSSALAKKASFFGEVTATPHVASYEFEVERSFVRYDYNDAFKISFGRFHTPIGYWNDAFHHGLWLQTTIRRPEQVRIGGIYVPVHFVGLKAEGDIPSGLLGLGYEIGVGNGRSEVLSRAGDAGDPNTNRAWLADLLIHPIVPYGLKAGVSAYRDRLSIGPQPAIDEWILSGYTAWTRETPELIGEYIAVRHTDELTSTDYNSRAFYLQAACRLPGRAHVAKPYARYEKLDVASGEPVFGFPDLEVVTAGARFDFMALVAFKAEYRNERATGSPRVKALLLQACFTF